MAGAPDTAMLAILRSMSTTIIHPAAAFQGHKAAVYALCTGRSPGRFLSACGEGIVVEWDLDEPDQGEAIAKVGQAVFSLHVLAQHDLLLIGTGTGRLVVIDLRMRVEVQALDAHAKGIFRIGPLGTDHIACAGGDGVLSIWKITASRTMPLEVIRRIPLCEEKLRDIAVEADGRRLVVACGDGSLRELDLPSLNERQRFEGHANGATSAAFHPGKPVLVSGGKDGEVRIWRADGTLLHHFPAHKGAVYSTTFDPSGRHLVSTGRDALVKVWDAGTLDPLWRSVRERAAHTHSVNAALWSGAVLVTASDDRAIRAWRMPERPDRSGPGLVER